MTNCKIKPTDDDHGVIEVALAIMALGVVLLFSAYLTELIAVTNRVQTGLSEALRNLGRDAQATTRPISASQALALAENTLLALNLSSTSLDVKTSVTSSICPTESFTLSIINPLLPTVRITSMSTQQLGFDPTCS